MATKIATHQGHIGKADKVLTVDFAALDREWRRRKWAAENPPDSFTAREYAVKHDIKMNCAQWRLGQMKKAGLLRVVDLMRNGVNIRGWQIVKDKK